MLSKSINQLTKINPINIFKFGTLPIKDLNLKEKDPELSNLIKEEMNRQFQGIELIASENYAGKAVRECLGSALTNKYSEGYPGKRYYGGNQVVDKIERLAQKRSLEAFNLSPKEWAVNVQPYSGSPANFAVYTGLLGPHGKMMGLLLSHGGHLTHGFQTNKKKVSATSLFFNSQQYTLDENTGLVDMKKLEKEAMIFRPDIIICVSYLYLYFILYYREDQLVHLTGIIRNFQESPKDVELT